MRRLTRLSCTLIAWWGAGALAAVTLAALRDVVGDDAIPYARPINLGRDIDWIDAHLPSDVTERLRPDGGEYAWRINGMQLVGARWGEESARFELWRVLPNRIIERDVPHSMVVVERLRRGWPLLCLEGARWTPGQHAAIEDRLLYAASGSGNALSIPFGIRLLPLSVNGAVFGSVFFALTIVPRSAERIVRWKQGRCIQCGHPLAGARRCTECGKERGNHAR